MKCPICTDMHLIMSDRHGIEIDYCPQCRGVWLDRDELEKLIDRSATAVIADAPPRHRSTCKHTEQEKLHGYSKEGYGQKNKKDLIGELFNF